MKIECEINPDDLIEKIGDAFFYICDETCDEFYRHPKHPHILRIIDCEDETIIDVQGSSIEDTRIIAESLCKLLNQDYSICHKKDISLNDDF